MHVLCQVCCLSARVEPNAITATGKSPSGDTGKVQPMMITYQSSAQSNESHPKDALQAATEAMVAQEAQVRAQKLPLTELCTSSLIT